jgi:menaquinone-dependent protoporphyrinogen IX oxidase
LRKIFKIILSVFAILIIVGVASFSLIMFDVAGTFATDTHPLPNGAAIEKAIVIYDPGLSGGAKDVATKISYNLQDSGYDVTLAGVKSSTAANLTGYSVVVVGGPIYAGKPASSIQSYLNSLNPPANAIVGAFGYGSVQIDNTNQTSVQQDVAPHPTDSTVTLNAVVKIVSGNNVDANCQDFVSRLLM